MREAATRRHLPKISHMPRRTATAGTVCVRSVCAKIINHVGIFVVDERWIPSSQARSPYFRSVIAHSCLRACRLKGLAGMVGFGGRRPRRQRVVGLFSQDFLFLLALQILCAATHALTQHEIDTLLDGNIIVGNRASGGKIQIFPANVPNWNRHNVLWEYDTKEGVDGLTMDFDHINDVKRVRYHDREYILIAGNGPGLALFDLYEERFVFSYKPRVPAGERCSMKSISIHAAEMLPDGNFVVADPTGDDRGGASVRLIYGSNKDPTILQSLPFSGAHGVVWDHKRQLLWAWGGSKLKKYRYISAGKDSYLEQHGIAFKSPDWISVGHDMMPLGPDALIFNCAEGLGVFYIEHQTVAKRQQFELLYGTIDMATHFALDTKLLRGKGVDFNYKTGQIIQNLFETNTVRSPNVLQEDRSVMEWSYEPEDDMKMYKARWFIHNEFSYGKLNSNAIKYFLHYQTINRHGGPTNRRPQFLDEFRRNAIVTVGESYKRNIRKQSTDPDDDEWKPIYEKICGPSWLSINRAGMIEGTPDAKDVDDDYRTMVIRVSDRNGLSDTAEFNFKVKEPETPEPTPEPITKRSPTRAPSALRPTNHPTTHLFSIRSYNFKELIYFSPELVGPGWKAEGMGPFGRCAGDCDRDEDCRDNLRCWQRSGLDNNIPGCAGRADEHVDYCYDPQMVMNENIATIPAKSLTAAPSKRPTTQVPTQGPTETDGDEVWNAFMGMVNAYANAKKNRLGEDSLEPSPEPTSSSGLDANASSQPTTAFHAAWKGGMERWKKSIQEDVANIPTGGA